MFLILLIPFETTRQIDQIHFQHINQHNFLRPNSLNRLLNRNIKVKSDTNMIFFFPVKNKTNKKR